MLYVDVKKIRGEDVKPRHEYTGKLIHFVLVKSSEMLGLESKQRYITTSLEKRTGLNIIHIYYNGKRITGKRISNDAPVLHESHSLIDWLIMQIRMEQIK